MWHLKRHFHTKLQIDRNSLLSLGGSPLLVATFFSTLTGLMHSCDGAMKSSKSVSCSTPLNAMALKTCKLYVAFRFFFFFFSGVLLSQNG
jgi:hypothetical protein